MAVLFTYPQSHFWQKSLFNQIIVMLCVLTSIPCAQATVMEHIVLEWFNPYNFRHPNRIELLRSSGYSRQHRLIKNAYVNMPFEKKQGLSHKVKVVSIEKYRMGNSRKNNAYEPVTGIFIHQVKHLKTWHFVDQSNHITFLNATDNHPFYVKNLHAFLPIKDITPQMPLDANGQTIHLLCHGALNHCGKPYDSGRAVYVYNIEVGDRHVYRVGSEGILVHNCAAAIKKDKQLRFSDTVEDVSFYYGETSDMLVRTDSLSTEKEMERKEALAILSKSKTSSDRIEQMLAGYDNLAYGTYEEILKQRNYIEFVTTGVPYRNNNMQLFTLNMCRNRQWHFSHLPPDLRNNSLHYANAFNSGLAAARGKLGQMYIAPKSAIIDFSNNITIGEGKRFIKKCWKFFNKVIGRVYGNKPINMGNISHVGNSQSRVILNFSAG